MCFMGAIKAWGWRSPLLHYSDPSSPLEIPDSQCTWESKLAFRVLLTSTVTSETAPSFPPEVCGTEGLLLRDWLTEAKHYASSTPVSPKTKSVLLHRGHWLSWVLLWVLLWAKQEQLGQKCEGRKGNRRLKGQRLKKQTDRQTEIHSWHLGTRWCFSLQWRPEKIQGQQAARKDRFLHLRNLYVIQGQRFKSK